MKGAVGGKERAKSAMLFAMPIGKPMTVREVQARVRMYAVGTVAQYLRELWREGRLEVARAPRPGWATQYVRRAS